MIKINWMTPRHNNNTDSFYDFFAEMTDLIKMKVNLRACEVKLT